MPKKETILLLEGEVGLRPGTAAPVVQGLGVRGWGAFLEGIKRIWGRLGRVRLSWPVVSKYWFSENYTLTAKDPKQLFGIRRTLWESTLGSGSLLWALGVHSGLWESTLGQPIWDLSRHLPVA